MVYTWPNRAAKTHVHVRLEDGEEKCIQGLHCGADTEDVRIGATLVAHFIVERWQEGRGVPGEGNPPGW